VQDADIEEQVRKLLAGQIRTDVALSAVPKAEESVSVPLAGLLPTNAGDSELVARQQNNIKRLRQAAAQRADATMRSAAAVQEERTLRETSYDRLLTETDRLVKAAEANLAFGVHSLERLNMQMPEVPSAAVSADEQPLTLVALEKSLDESMAAQQGLKMALDRYADWWLQRFFRLLALVASLIVLLIALRKVGETLVHWMVGLYTRLRAALVAVDPAWVEQALWIIALVGSVALLTLAVVSLARWINRRFFDTESKRSAVHQKIDSSRAELVRRVFTTDEQVMTKYFWGRMFVMVDFAIRQKMGS